METESARSDLPQPLERRREAWSWGFSPSSSIKHSRMAEGWEGRMWVGMHMRLEKETCLSEMKIRDDGAGQRFPQGSHLPEEELRVHCDLDPL